MSLDLQMVAWRRPTGFSKWHFERKHSPFGTLCGAAIPSNRFGAVDRTARNDAVDDLCRKCLTEMDRLGTLEGRRLNLMR